MLKNVVTTTMPHNPSTLLQEISCDAGKYNLGTKEFYTQVVKWRKNVN